jgi:hypothetical protein
MKIEIRKGEPLVPGNKYSAPYRDIFVDGEKWGWVNIRHHGSNGTTYDFTQAGAGGLIRVPRDGNDSTYVVTVNGDKIASRASRGIRVAPLESRLITQISKLIHDQHLRYPREIAVEQKKRQEEHDRAIQEQKAEKRAKFRVKAIVCLSALPPLAQQVSYDPLLDRIVDAMEWAQSQ